jgi:Raf kinase inhibitor-like YbhB/YbcL family protein
MRLAVCAVVKVILIAGMAGQGQVSSHMMESKAKQLSVTSPAFRDGERIPVRYTADGDNMSPPLQWSGSPAGVSEYAVICEDPDAPGGTFTHWVIYGIPGSYDRLDAGVRQEVELDNGAMQGPNSDDTTGYTGPSPPPGKPHRYQFKVYALSAKLDLPAGITKDELQKAMSGYVVAQGTITGLYGR